MTAFLVVFLVVAPLGWLLVRYIEWKQIYQPSREVEQEPSAVGLAFEDIRFMSEDGNPLHGWWMPHPEAIGAVIYCHGNGGNLGDRLEVFDYLHRMELHVFAFDYRGYGRSRGVPTESGTYRDARAAYEVVRARYGDVESPPIVVFGRSLGGAVAAQLALDKRVRALLIEGSFESVSAMAKQRYPSMPIHRLCHPRYATRSKIQHLRGVPLLVSHSIDDERIGFFHGRSLFAAAPEPKQFVELRGPHDQIGWATTAGYWETSKAFFHQALSS